jgi:hypothetical protein
MTIILKDLSDKSFVHMLKNIVAKLDALEVAGTELLNIRDEMLASINQTLYLCSLA